MKAKRISGLLLAGLAVATLASCSSEEIQPFGIGPGHRILSSSKYTREVNLSTINDLTKNAEKLALLENYSINNRTYGYVLANTGGLQKFRQDRILIPTDDYNAKPRYLKGYGFGLVSEGVIEGVDKGTGYKYSGYHHTYESNQDITANTVNYFNDRGSTSGSYFGQIHASYYDTRLIYDETNSKLDTEYIAVLVDGTTQSSKNVETDTDPIKQREKKIRPIALTDDGTIDSGYKSGKTRKKWRIYLKTTKSCPTLKYTIKDDEYKKGNPHRADVKIEDYLTGFKYLELGSAPVARTQENKGDSSELVGAADYFVETKNLKDKINKGVEASEIEQLETAFSSKFTGVKVGDDEGKEYIEFEFVKAVSSFYAQYYLNSVLATPIPQDFIKHVGGLENYGTGANGKGVEKNVVQTGYSILDEWVLADKSGANGYIALSQNKDLVEAGFFGKNQIKETLANEHTTFKLSTFGKLAASKMKENRYQGVKGTYIIGLGIDKDPKAAWKMFTEDKEKLLDMTGVPSSEVDAQINQADVAQITTHSNTKMIANTTNQETWDYLFGKHGVVSKNNQGYRIKPILSNKNFIKAIDYLIDREDFAKKVGLTPSIDFLNKTYIADPETDKNKGYSETKEHEKVLKDYYGETEYAELVKGKVVMTKAAQLLQQAVKELTEGENAPYRKGDEIELSIMYTQAAAYENIGKHFQKTLEDNINNALKIGNEQMLRVRFKESWDPENWKKMYDNIATGKYDFAIGGINGSALDPLGFMQILKSDNSSGFTLNFSIDTNKVYEDTDGKIVDGTYIDTTALFEGDVALQTLPRIWSFDAFYNGTQGSSYIRIRESKDKNGNTIQVAEADSFLDADRLDHMITYDENGENLEGRDAAIMLINYAAVNSKPGSEPGDNKDLFVSNLLEISLDTKIDGVSYQQILDKKFDLLNDTRPKWLPENIDVDRLKGLNSVKTVNKDTKVIAIYLDKDTLAKLKDLNVRITLSFDLQFVPKEGKEKGKTVHKDRKLFISESFK